MATSTDEAQLMMDALKMSAEWRALSPQQKVWISEVFTNGGDMVAATRVAYPEAKPSSQVVMSYQIPKAPAVMAAFDWLRWHNASNSRMELIALVRKQLEACEPGSVAAQRFASQLERLTLGYSDAAIVRDTEPAEIRPSKDPIEPAAKQEAYSIGKRVIEKDDQGRDRVGIIRGFNPDGTPIVEELRIGHEF